MAVEFDPILGLLRLKDSSAGGGGGSVSSVSVTTANGISGTVANPTTTPAITLSLAAITPSTVNGITLSGSSTPSLAVTGTSNISGSNTGDQDLSGLVPTTRTVNGHALSGNLTITPDDLTDTTTTHKFVGAADITKLGNLSGTNTGDQTTVTGNAGTATALQTARTINGVSFDGTANITVADSTKAVKGANSDITSLSGLTTPLSVGQGGTGAATLTGILKGNGTSAVTAVTAPAGAIVGTTDTQILTHKDVTDATNTFPTFNQNTTGSAAKLTTARTIAGVSFDGSTNVSLTTGGGIQKGDGSGGLTAATSGTDYAPATSGTAILKGNGSGGFSSAAAGTDYLAFSGTAKISVGTSTPTSPSTGDLWVDTN